jgi:hypothetical protein
MNKTKEPFMTSCKPIPANTKDLLAMYGVKNLKKETIEKASIDLLKKDSEAYEFVSGLTGNQLYVDNPEELAIGYLVSEKKSLATTPESIQLFNCLNANPKKAFLHSIYLLRSLMRQNNKNMARLKKEEAKYMKYGGISKSESDAYCKERVEQKVNDIIKELSKESESNMPFLPPRDKQLVIDYLLGNKTEQDVHSRLEELAKDPKVLAYEFLTNEKKGALAFHNLLMKTTRPLEGYGFSVRFRILLKAEMKD